MSKTRLVIDCGILLPPIGYASRFRLSDWALRTLLNLCNHFQTTDFLLCWDSNQSLRKLIYPEYKANRKRDDSPIDWESYRKEREYIRKSFFPNLGFINNAYATGYEADDLIAKAVAGHHDYIIVTNDSDHYQLLEDGKVSIWSPEKNAMYTYQDFCRDYQFEPYEYVNYKCMVGDSSDNIKGIPKVGPKRALEVIRKGTWQDTRAAFSDILLRNEQLIALPFKDCPDVEWTLNAPRKEELEKLDGFFASELGQNIIRKFSGLLTETASHRSIRIRRRNNG